MVKVLGIEGSPRKGGNSELLLDAFLEGARSKGARVEKLTISGLKIAPCDEGNICHKTGICRIKDDMQWIYDKLLNTDHLVIACPTFFMGPPAQLKCLIDRCQALWARRFVLKKVLRGDDKEHKAFLLATAALDKKEAFQAAKNTMKALYYVLGFKYAGELFVGGVDKRGDVKSKKGALDKACRMGAGLCQSA